MSDKITHSNGLNPNNNMVLTINDFGPISHADININKINVIAGKNSTGKSTASKLLYCFLRANSSDRQSYGLKSLYPDMRSLFEELEENNIDMDKFRKFRNLTRHIRLEGPIPIDDFYVDNYIEDFYSFKKEIEKSLDSSKSSDFRSIYIKNKLNNVEHLIKIVDENSKDFFVQLMENLIGSEFSIYDPNKSNEDLKYPHRSKYAHEGIYYRADSYKMRIARELDHLINFINKEPDLKDILTETDIQKIKNFLEEDDSSNITDKSRSNYDESSQFALLVNNLEDTYYKIDFKNFIFDYADWLTLENVFYIESFSYLDFSSFGPRSNMDHVIQLRRALRSSPSKELFDSIRYEKIIQIEDKINQIIKGNFSFSRGIKFNFEDESLEMKNTASGIKQIGIIQMLLDNRRLNENSFLIIDEPEVNLHPEWQLKFAEILVLLAKDLDITLYLNTHSPLFINAINIYSELYELEDNTNYYLTRPCENNGYTFDSIPVDDLYEIYDELGQPFQEIKFLKVDSILD